MFMLASTSAVWTHLLLAKILTQWFHSFWLIIVKPGVSLSNQSSSVGTLHSLKKVTYSFVDVICKWITKLLVLLMLLVCKSRPAARGPWWPSPHFPQLFCPAVNTCISTCMSLNSFTVLIPVLIIISILLDPLFVACC